MDVRQVLADDRAATLARVAALSRELAQAREASGGSDDEHDPDGASTAFERAQLDALAAAANRHLADIEAALSRVSEGTYGRCTRCGGVVPAGRLEARPTAATCITCA